MDIEEMVKNASVHAEAAPMTNVQLTEVAIRVTAILDRNEQVDRNLIDVGFAMLASIEELEARVAELEDAS